MDFRANRLLSDGLRIAAGKHPGKTALVAEGKPCSYGQLLDAAQRLAARLAAEGVHRGDRVAIFMDNTWPCVVSIYATLLAGAAMLVVNPLTKADKLTYILNDSDQTRIALYSAQRTTG